MILEQLKAEEFSDLGTIADGLAPDPRHSIAIVVREKQEIVARIFLVTPVHIEGPWIRPDLRNGTLASRLVRAAADTAKNAGARTLFAYAANEEIEGYLKRLGFRREPLTIWSKEL